VQYVLQTDWLKWNLHQPIELFIESSLFLYTHTRCVSNDLMNTISASLCNERYPELGAMHITSILLHRGIHSWKELENGLGLDMLGCGQWQ